MKRFLRRTLFMLVPAILAALVLWVQASTSGASQRSERSGSAMPPLGLQSVTLSCTDGTLLNLELDATALTALADAVVAINLYPAGDPPLACSLSESSASSGSAVLRRLLALLTPNEAAASGNPEHDYAVGGGQVQKGLCTINFALRRDVQPDRATVVLDAILRANLLHLHRRPLGRQARLPPCGGQRRSTECHRHPL